MAEKSNQNDDNPLDRNAEEDLTGRANDDDEDMEDLAEEEEESDISEK